MSQEEIIVRVKNAPDDDSINFRASPSTKLDEIVKAIKDQKVISDTTIVVLHNGQVVFEPNLTVNDIRGHNGEKDVEIKYLLRYVPTMSDKQTDDRFAKIESKYDELRANFIMLVGEFKASQERLVSFTKEVCERVKTDLVMPVYTEISVRPKLYYMMNYMGDLVWVLPPPSSSSSSYSTQLASSSAQKDAIIKIASPDDLFEAHSIWVTRKNQKSVGMYVYVIPSTSHVTEYKKEIVFDTPIKQLQSSSLSLSDSKTKTTKNDMTTSTSILNQGRIRLWHVKVLLLKTKEIQDAGDQRIQFSEKFAIAKIEYEIYDSQLQGPRMRSIEYLSNPTIAPLNNEYYLNQSVSSVVPTKEYIQKLLATK